MKTELSKLLPKIEKKIDSSTKQSEELLKMICELGEEIGYYKDENLKLKQEEITDILSISIKAKKYFKKVSNTEGILSDIVEDFEDTLKCADEKIKLHNEFLECLKSIENKGLQIKLSSIYAKLNDIHSAEIEDNTNEWKELYEEYNQIEEEQQKLEEKSEERKKRKSLKKKTNKK